LSRACANLGTKAGVLEPDLAAIKSSYPGQVTRILTEAGDWRSVLSWERAGDYVSRSRDSGRFVRLCPSSSDRFRALL